MQKVPKNKTIYVGARKYIEGDVLPPYVMLDIPVLSPKQVDIITIENKKDGKPKSSYRKRSKR